MLLNPLPLVTNCHTFSDPLPPQAWRTFWTVPFLPMQLHNCMRIKLCVQWTKNAIVMIVIKTNERYCDGEYTGTYFFTKKPGLNKYKTASYRIV